MQSDQLIISPSEAGHFEHVAYDGKHPENSLYQKSCPVCDNLTDYVKGEMLEMYAEMVFPNSPLAIRKRKQNG